MSLKRKITAVKTAANVFTQHNKAGVLPACFGFPVGLLTCASKRKRPLPSRNSPMTGFRQQGTLLCTYSAVTAWGLAPRSLFKFRSRPAHRGTTRNFSFIIGEIRGKVKGNPPHLSRYIKNDIPERSGLPGGEVPNPGAVKRNFYKEKATRAICLPVFLDISCSKSVILARASASSLMEA